MNHIRGTNLDHTTWSYPSQEDRLRMANLLQSGIIEAHVIDIAPIEDNTDINMTITMIASNQFLKKST